MRHVRRKCANVTATASYWLVAIVTRRFVDHTLFKLGDLTFLINDLSRAFTDAGIGNKMRDWCDQAGLPHCTTHGLRKAGATIAAMNGATAHQLKAIFGWETLKQAEIYTRAADQIRLAQSGMHLLTAENESGANVWVPLSSEVGPFREKA